MILQTNIDAVTGLDDLDQNPFGAAHFALPRPVNGATKVCLATHTHTQATRHLRTQTPLTHPNHQQLRMRRLPPVGSEARKVQRAASGYRAASQRTRDWQAAFATLLGPGPPAVHVLPSAASTSCATTTGTGAGGGARGQGVGQSQTPLCSVSSCGSQLYAVHHGSDTGTVSCCSHSNTVLLLLLNYDCDLAVLTKLQLVVQLLV